MIKEIWINLPVKDVKRTKDFFTKIGFTLNKQHPDSDHSVGFMVGNKGVVIMFFAESVFKSFTQHDLTDTKQSSEVLFSFDAESHKEVDDMAEKVKNAGGDIFSNPAENQGWMYGFAFADPDGHRWNMLHMDLNKIPKG